MISAGLWYSLCKICQNMGFLWHISSGIRPANMGGRKFIFYLGPSCTVLGLNTEIYGVRENTNQKKLRIRTLFMQWHILRSDWFIWKLHECCNYVNILLFTPILLLISWNPLESIHGKVYFYCSYSMKLTFFDFVFNLILSNSVNRDVAILQSYMIFYHSLNWTP